MKNDWSYTFSPPICLDGTGRNDIFIMWNGRAWTGLVWFRLVSMACSWERGNGRYGRVRLKCDGTRAETRFRLSAKRTSPFKSAGASVQSTAESRGVRISGSNSGYTTFRGSVRLLAAHSIRQFPLYFPSRASQCAISFQTHCIINVGNLLISWRTISFSRRTVPHGGGWLVRWCNTCICK